jgi:hypothetical protein
MYCQCTVSRAAFASAVSLCSCLCLLRLRCMGSRHCVHSAPCTGRRACSSDAHTVAKACSALLLFGLPPALLVPSYLLRLVYCRKCGRSRAGSYHAGRVWQADRRRRGSVHSVVRALRAPWLRLLVVLQRYDVTNALCHLRIYVTTIVSCARKNVATLVRSSYTAVSHHYG